MIRYLSSDGVKQVLKLLMLFLMAFAMAYLFAKGGIPVAGAFFVLPFAIAGFILICIKPHFGLFLCLIIAYTVLGITRYVNLPLGLALEIVLWVTLLALLFRTKKEDFGHLNNLSVWLMVVWTAYTTFEIFNPEAKSFEAWFYAVRAISFNILFLIMAATLGLRSQRYLNIFIAIWMVGAAVSALYGMKQLYIGLDAAENRWLAEGAADTHILFGRLRVFSFYSDAGQFGAFMAFSSLVGLILGLKARTTFKRFFYISCGLLCFWGMAISGTRGAVFVFSGFFFYLVLTKNFRILLLGFLCAGAAFYVLKYTYIGQGNYQIQRIRSAMNPDEDPSFQVRLENQKKLRAYLATRPFGGGIGSIGYWGKRFSPGTFLAETPPDSHYVRIWAETGIVGLTIHLGAFIIILIRAFVITYKIRDIYLKQKMMAFYSGVFGVLVASYGNQILSQMPLGVFFSIAVAYLFMAPTIDKSLMGESSISFNNSSK
ncbi:MAG: O-antigen ligase family protein [Cytophagaceae bacterium]